MKNTSNKSGDFVSELQNDFLFYIEVIRHLEEQRKRVEKVGANDQTIQFFNELCSWTQNKFISTAKLLMEHNP